jgi:hypothetical protein
MADQTCIWTDKSGRQYEYRVYPRDATIKSFIDDFNRGCGRGPFPPLREEDWVRGNFIFAKLNDRNQWVPVYFGIGDLSVLVDEIGRPSKQSLDLKGVTHVHMRYQFDMDDAAWERLHLLESYPIALEPHGCNVIPGGFFP